MDAHLKLDGPVLFFGGPYSNLEATCALLAEATRRGIPPKHVICTGDVVAYCADAKGTIDLVRQSGIRVVMGNCEESLAQGAADCGCGFTPGSACDRLSGAWFAHADGELGADERAWMAGLPRRLDVEILPAGARLCVVHGSLAEINRFVFASDAESAKAGDLEVCGADGIVAGHCGLPFTQIIDGRLWHNPGAIGMPANDGTPRVWFSVVKSGSGAGVLEVEHVALSYDHEAAAAKMRSVSLPPGYADALSTGLWPSCDVLPALELEQRGKPLTETAVRYATGRPRQTSSPRATATSPRLNGSDLR
jgi:hypothetical protein